MIAARGRWVATRDLILLASSCFGLGFMGAFLIPGSDTSELASAPRPSDVAETAALSPTGPDPAIAPLQERVKALEAELAAAKAAAPKEASQLQPGTRNFSLGEPVKVRTTRVGPDGQDKARR